MTWFQSPKIIKDTSGSVRQWITPIATLVLIGAAAGVFYFISNDKSIELEVIAPEEEIAPGDIFDISLVFSNQSKSALENVRLTLGLPAGVKLLDHPDRVNEVREVGDVSWNSSVKETYTLVALPSEEKDAHTLALEADYLTGSLSANFEIKQEEKLKIKKIDHKLSLNVPESGATGEVFPVEARYEIEDTQEENQLSRYLVIEGEDLLVVSSEPESITPGRWQLEGDGIDISAKITQKTTDVVLIKGKIVVEFGGNDYVVEETEAELLLSPSPLVFDVRLNDSKNAVGPGELLNYTVTYNNQTSADLRDVVIRAELVGEMFDFDSLKTDGSFNNLNKTITWDSSKLNKLREVKVGDNGELSIAVRVSPDFPIDSLSDKNFLLKVNATLESPTVIQGSDTDRTSQTDTLELKVAGNVAVDTRAYFRDASSGILNQGPFPPRVGAATEYTIHWDIANYGTDVEDVIVRARVEDNVIFTGESKSTTEFAPEFDEANRQVFWRIPSLSATDGVLNKGPEAVFQISAIPSASFLGDYLPLISITTISARDTYTGTELLNTNAIVTTRLQDDSTVGSNDGRVVQ